MTNSAFAKAVSKKVLAAAQLLHSSIGAQGIFAGPGDRYRNQYWIRDFGVALMPGIKAIASIYGRENLYGGLEFAAADHLVNVWHRQDRCGAVPILFSDFPQLLAAKVLRKGNYDPATGNLKVGDSFVLRRILEGRFGDVAQFPEFADFNNPRFRDERGLSRLTPGTTDSELMFAYAVLTCGDLFSPATTPSSTQLHEAAWDAVNYLESHHVRHGLMVGADWRDTMEKFFSDKFVLSNNVMRYQVHKMLYSGEERRIAARIEETFWNGTSYIDYPGADRFDPLGASLAVLHGLVPKERFESVMAGFYSVNTDIGVTIKCRHNAYAPGEKEVIERTDGVVVWPFVCGFAALAALKMGYPAFAFEQLAKMTMQDGFGEWYDPGTGKQHGEPQQGWSAALYLMVCEAALKDGKFTRAELTTMK